MIDPRETLARIRARVEKATPGPWVDVVDDLNEDVDVYHDREYRLWIANTGNLFTASAQLARQTLADAEFIAHARTDVPVMDAALTAVLNALDDLDSKHHIHGHECLCGFTSARSRSRTEHLTAEVRAAITAALEGETP